VDWLQRLPSESVMRLASTGLPRQVLRHLIFEHDAGVGSRVLDVGCGSGELVRYLHQLGFRVAGLDESPEMIAAARHADPHLDFHCERVEKQVSVGKPSFDLVLVRNLEPYTGNLLSVNALWATANLLKCVRPGGHLVFVDCHETAAPEGAAGHAAACYARHLSVFPGPCRTALFRDGIIRRMSWNWIPRRSPYSGIITASIQCPENPFTRVDWLSLADAASTTHSTPCCQWARISSEQQAKRRTAA